MKKYLIGIFALLLLLNIFSCSSSPTAMKVGTIRIDASEYAYYLNYNRLNLERSARLSYCRGKENCWPRPEARPSSR